MSLMVLQSRHRGIPRSIHGERFLFRYPFSHQFANDFEIEAFDELERVLRPGMIVCDIGANFGLFTLVAARQVGPTGKVYAFEPASATAHVLKDHVRLNGMQGLVDVIETVVEQEVGLVDFWEQETSLMASLSQEWTDADRLFSPSLPGPSHTIRPAVTIDAFCDHLRRLPDVLKIDVEGAEARVLRGATRFLHGKQGHILLEVHPHALQLLGDSASAVFDHLSSAGWTYREVGRKVPAIDSQLTTVEYLCAPA
jgi:FkbM family methyltransferase